MTDDQRIAFAAMKPLPKRPSFPVFGLSDSYEGFRWLLMWQRRIDPWTGDVTQVDLAHGHWDGGPFIVVRNVLKQPVRDLGNGASASAIGVEHVASGLVHRALHQSSTAADDLHALWMREQELIEETADGGAVLHGWSTATVSIDGTEVQAHKRDINNARATVVDFPTHVLGVIDSGRPFAALALKDVTAALNAYRAGTDHRADSLLT